MLNGVITHDTFIPQSKKIFLKFKQNVAIHEILSPENVRKQDDKVYNRVDKLKALFSPEGVPDAGKSGGERSGDLQHWIDKKMMRKRPKGGQNKSYLYA